MSIVFVLQEQPGRNILPAAQFGVIRVVFPMYKQIEHSGCSLVRELQHAFKDFSDNDYLLLMGDPVIIGVSVAIAVYINNGRVRLLKWDRLSRRYSVVLIDLK